MITDIKDLHARAKRRIPKAIFDYVDGGSYTESTLDRNRRALDSVLLRQRVLRDITGRQITTRLFGEEWSMPLALAPTGLTGFVHPNGETAAYRAAACQGVPFTLSTVSINNTDDLTGQADRPFWFQIYVMRDKEFTRFLLDRARRAGCRVLVVTVDLVVNAQRHRDVKNGLNIPFRVTWPTALDAVQKPRWFLRMLQSKRRSFGNFEGYPLAGETALSMAQWVMQQYEPKLTPQHLQWIRDEWDGPLIVKGIMDVEDAQTAKSFGADGIVVSNHGGRQLDGGLSPVDVLPSIRKAVGADFPVLADSGVCTGGDIFRLLALGADACLIGRAFLWGLGAQGEKGVCRAIEILRQELDVAMALTGCSRLANIHSGLITQDPLVLSNQQK